MRVMVMVKATDDSEAGAPGSEEMFTDSDIDIRPVYENEDFGEEFTSEARAIDAKLRERIGDSAPQAQG